MPLRVGVPDHSWQLHSVAATRALESQAAAALPPHTLMARAGWAVARCALAIAPHAEHIAVVAGPGNNGGDGLEAAVHLRAAGKQVTATLLGDPQQLPADALAAWHKAQAAGVVFGPLPEDVDLLIDALLGIGGGSAIRPLSAALQQMIEQINARVSPCLAIDLPSGLNADTGAVHSVAVRATHTLALLTLKPGLFTAQGRDHAGDIWLDDLQVTDASGSITALLNGREATQPWRRPRPHASHKGRFGDVLVVGGAAGMQGAAGLAGHAALRAGAGRVFVSALATSPPTWPELMWQPDRWHDVQAVSQATVVAGCGGGEAIAAALPLLLSRAPRLVLDADALNAIAADSALQILLQQRAARGAATVLTPHPLEAARLLGVADAMQIQADRLQAATSLAARFHCTVALKGSGTVIASPGALPCINPTGNGRLASAGTGDVLAGWMAGRWSVRPQAEAQAVACCAAWEHGMAAHADDAMHHAPMVASDLIEALSPLR